MTGITGSGELEVFARAPALSIFLVVEALPLGELVSKVGILAFEKSVGSLVYLLAV